MPLRPNRRDQNQLQNFSPGPRLSSPLLLSLLITSRGWGSLVRMRMSLRKPLKNLAARSRLETILWSCTRRRSIWIERFYTLTRITWERCNSHKTQIVEKDKVASAINISRVVRQKSYRATHLLGPLLRSQIKAVSKINITRRLKKEERMIRLSMWWVPMIWTRRWMQLFLRKV